VEIQLLRIKGYKFFYDYIVKEDCDGCGRAQNVTLEEVQVVEVGILRELIRDVAGAHSYDIYLD
jgi:hypothetical protein